jgi:transposase
MICLMEMRHQNYSCTPENIALLIETNNNLSKENSHLKANLEAAEKKIVWLVEQFKLGKQRQFGKKTENGEQLQLELVFDEIEGTEESTEIQTIEESADAETITYARKKKTVGRKIDTNNLPREQIVYDLTEEEKHCKCGGRLEKFGEDKSEQLEYIPAQLKVIEHICSKYACRSCETLRTSSKPEMPIAKCMAAPSSITEVIIKKYEHHRVSRA